MFHISRKGRVRKLRSRQYPGDLQIDYSDRPAENLISY